MKLDNLYKIKYEVHPEGSSYILVKAPSLMNAMLLAEHSFDKPIKILFVGKV